jgi:hypothetical protein
MANALNNAPKMVELQSEQMIVNKEDYRNLLEEVLGVEQKLGEGKSPFEVYRRLVSDASDKYRFDKNNMSNKDKITGIQKRIGLIDLYFNEFVQLDEPKVQEEVSPIDHTSPNYNNRCSAVAAVNEDIF